MPRLPEPPPGLQAKADQMLADLQAALAGVQTSYLASKGRYWQGLSTPATVPADGTELAPDLTRRPTDQTETWTGAGVALPATVPVAVRVDVYDGPAGWGYVVAGLLTIGSRQYERRINVGPESYRQTNSWEVIA